MQHGTLLDEDFPSRVEAVFPNARSARSAAMSLCLSFSLDPSHISYFDLQAQARERHCNRCKHNLLPTLMTVVCQPMVCSHSRYWMTPIKHGKRISSTTIAVFGLFPITRLPINLVGNDHCGQTTSCFGNSGFLRL